ncbi:MAG: NAD(P)/FAD-dependent oxidoreductase [Gemmatimonadales bacterium]
MATTIEIVGAGPAGLAAAITVAKHGGRAIVYERHRDVGQRFHGDFQGLENWTTAGDVLDEFAAMGIEPTFEHTPFRECVFYDPAGREYYYRAARPIWYLTRRGTEVGTLDQSLKAQALDAGVDIRLGAKKDHLPHGGIVAHGPRRVDAIAVGYLFETDLADGAFCAVSDRLAPKGYSYLLVAGGRGTIASCMFADFHNDKQYLERTVEFFRRKVDFQMRNARAFGGYGNVHADRRARKGRILYVGEAAGFQDTLFGFGMRYALRSGHLAARAWLSNKPETYDRLWRGSMENLTRLATVNRYMYELLGDRGYAFLLRKIERAPDVRDWLRVYYTRGRWKLMLHPYVRRHSVQRKPLVKECVRGCDCTWCRCPDDRTELASAGKRKAS